MIHPPEAGDDSALQALEAKETLKGIVPVIFLKLGGTWDMVERDGRRVGSGNLDDDELRRIQEEIGLLRISPSDTRRRLCKTLAAQIYQRFLDTSPEPRNTAQHLGSWCRDFQTGERIDDYVNGPFIPLFSGDSSHLKPYLTAPMIMYVLKLLLENPTIPILAGQGTDTADIAVASGVDVMLYDTELPILNLTGANHPHTDPESDAPGNFMDSARLARVELRSGAYWNFHGYLYPATDFVKIDPVEARRIEDQGTFFSPHRSTVKIATLLQHSRPADWQKRRAPAERHVFHKLTMESIFDAFDEIYVTDLGNQNPGWHDMERIFDAKTRGIVVAGHSLGNVDNEIRADLVEAAKMGKLIVSVSRTMIGSTSSTYAASLAAANDDPRELGGSEAKIIIGHKLNRTIARALLARAIIEGLDQKGTQRLFTDYAQSRGMHTH